MVDIAQLVSASGCGPEGRRFESDYPPHTKSAAYFIICRFFIKISETNSTGGKNE